MGVAAEGGRWERQPEREEGARPAAVRGVEAAAEQGRQGHDWSQRGTPGRGLTRRSCRCRAYVHRGSPAHRAAHPNRHGHASRCWGQGLPCRGRIAEPAPEPSRAGTGATGAGAGGRARRGAEAAGLAGATLAKAACRVRCARARPRRASGAVMAAPQLPSAPPGPRPRCAPPRVGRAAPAEGDGDGDAGGRRPGKMRPRQGEVGADGARRQGTVAAARRPGGAAGQGRGDGAAEQRRLGQGRTRRAAGTGVGGMRAPEVARGGAATSASDVWAASRLSCSRAGEGRRSVEGGRPPPGGKVEPPGGSYCRRRL
jgi:hypothetical protein